MANYNRKDHFYEKAKEEGFRSRAAYKLLELNDKFKIFRKGQRVLDLGAWPGGWLQVASEKIGETGIAVGIDLMQIDDFGKSNIKILKGDVRDSAILEQALAISGRAFDIVLSDMSPKLTGIREIDQAATIGCAELAFYVAQKILAIGGDLVIKVFKGNDTEQFVKTLRPVFNKVTRTELKSSRKTSNEFYIFANGHR